MYDTCMYLVDEGTTFIYQPTLWTVARRGTIDLAITEELLADAAVTVSTFPTLVIKYL